MSNLSLTLTPFLRPLFNVVKMEVDEASSEDEPIYKGDRGLVCGVLICLRPRTSLSDRLRPSGQAHWRPYDRQRSISETRSEPLLATPATASSLEPIPYDRYGDVYIATENETSAWNRNSAQYIGASPKLMLMEIMLPKLKQRGKRVPIFSQFLGCLGIIEDFLNILGLQYGRIDGRMVALKKHASKIPWLRPMLATPVSTGGTGLLLV
ncbi:hypothetical protein GGR52DRAFT_567242 [Hypoxylon sp. FL1284]|nr:hypothetical protein GGR52DRAFT_567242 [Hypoxylon sp. FL1284]